MRRDKVLCYQWRHCSKAGLLLGFSIIGKISRAFFMPNICLNTQGCYYVYQSPEWGKNFQSISILTLNSFGKHRFEHKHCDEINLVKSPTNMSHNWQVETIGIRALLTVISRNSINLTCTSLLRMTRWGSGKDLNVGVWSVQDGGDGRTGVGRGGEILGGHTPAPWSVDRHRQPGLKRGLVGRLYHENKPTLKRPLPDTPAAPSSLPVGFSTAPGPGSALRERPVTLLSNKTIFNK